MTNVIALRLKKNLYGIDKDNDTKMAAPFKTKLARNCHLNNVEKRFFDTDLIK